MNAAQTLLFSWISPFVYYAPQDKSPHANVPTPPRKHWPRKAHSKKLFRV